MRRAEFLLYRDCAGSVMLPTFCLYQRCIDDENLKRSALGLISELALHPEVFFYRFMLRSVMNFIEKSKFLIKFAMQHHFFHNWWTFVAVHSFLCAGEE